MILPPQPPPNRPKMASSSAKMAQDRSKTAPRPPQDLPKTILKRFFSHLLFCLRFGSDLGPTWAPFPTPLGAQNDPKIEPKNVRKSCCRKTASKIAPRRPRTPHRTPQDLPRPPQTSPGLPPWGSPGPLQEPPRSDFKIVLSLLSVHG